MHNSPARQVENPATYAFTRHERARLTVFQAAIAAGAYGDGHVQPNDGAYPFSERELVRLAVYRAAIQAGFYTDLSAE